MRSRPRPILADVSWGCRSLRSVFVGEERSVVSLYHCHRHDQLHLKVAHLLPLPEPSTTHFSERPIFHISSRTRMSANMRSIKRQVRLNNSEPRR